MYLSNKAIAGIVFGVTVIVGSGITVYLQNKKNKEEKQKKDSCTDEVFKSETVGNISAQAEGELVNVINTIRLDRLFKQLNEIDYNQQNAEKEIAVLKEEIEKIISSNRGYKTGMHGFLGETAQVHIANVKSFIKGENGLYVLLDDNSMTDYLRGTCMIQQKACQSDNHLGLDHIIAHKDKYPGFIKAGGIYQIPKDFYAKYKAMKSMPESTAMKLRREDLRLWRFVNKFAEENADITIEPMEVTYEEIQAGNIHSTVDKIEQSTSKEFSDQREKANKIYAPSLKEGIKIASISAIVEGTADAILVLLEKKKAGKKLKDIDANDRKEIALKFLIGFLRGGIRGGAVYCLTNLWKIPANIATTVTTACFSILRSVYQYVRRKKTRAEFYKGIVVDLITTCLSAVGAYFGKKALRNHPLLGSIIGSAVGMFGANYLQKVVYA